MRAAAGLVAIALLGALTAFALPRTGHAANPLLVAKVEDSYAISLTDADGHAVTSLPAGTYDIEVHDDTTFHNFHLSGDGVDEATTIAGTGVTTWTNVTFAPGAYHFQCDAHPSSMYGDFTVTGGTTTTTTTTATTTTTPSTTATSTTTSTSTSTTTTEPTTTAQPPAPPPPPPRHHAPRCIVPGVLRLTLPRARARIAHAGCRTGRVSRRRSRGRHGIVVAQRPHAGARVARGTRVRLVVSG